MSDKNKMNHQKRLMLKSILKLLAKNFEKERQQFIQPVLDCLEKGQQEKKQFKRITENLTLKKVFTELINEYSSWLEAFKTLSKQPGYEELASVDIERKLRDWQEKIDIKKLHNSYFTLFLLKKNELKISKDGLNQLKQIKKEVMEKRKQIQERTAKVEKMANTKKNDQRVKREELKQPQVQQEKKPKPPTQKKSVLHYMQTKRQFNFANQKEIAQYLQQKLSEFMNQKIEKVVKISKIKQLDFDSNQAGDEFRFYSENNKSYKNYGVEKIPILSGKILKVRYPSKLEMNNNLRIEEQLKQQDFRNEAKKRLEGDKKSDKFLQNYTLDQPKWNKTQIQAETINKRDRLKILGVTVQHVIESDPWFQDLPLMEMTFYK